MSCQDLSFSLALASAHHERLELAEYVVRQAILAAMLDVDALDGHHLARFDHPGKNDLRSHSRSSSQRCAPAPVNQLQGLHEQHDASDAVSNSGHACHTSPKAPRPRVRMCW